MGCVPNWLNQHANIGQVSTHTKNKPMEVELVTKRNMENAEGLDPPNDILN